MARTLIGRLQLVVQAMGLGEAKKVEGSLRSIEAAARRLSSAPWGQGFQRQIEKMALSAREIDNVRRSWANLHRDMASKGLTGALQKSEIAAWKTATLGHFAQVRAGAKSANAELDKTLRLMRMLSRPVMAAGGVGAFSWGLGMLGREAMTASAEQRREYFRQRMMNIPKGEQEALFNGSEALGQKYPSVPITGIMELSRGAYSVMGNAERAAGILERMVQSLVVLQSARGPEAATSQLTGLIRGLDNLGINKNGQVGIDQVNAMIDAATKAAQVDPDFDPGSFFNFARRTKVAGPALSLDFLTRAPVYMQDMGPDTTGNNLAMGFKAFTLEAVGSAGGERYLEERNRIGIRKNGKLIDEELFGSDPDQWVLKHLVPALARDGVDLDNDTQVAAAVGKLSGNTSATGFMTRIIAQREQVARWLGMAENAIGTDAAAGVRFEDPFVGFLGLKKSLENLAAAVLPIDSINAGLNRFADTINAFAAKVRAGDPAVLGTAGVIGGAAAVWGTAKVATGIWGLITAGASLQTAATMLQAAAVAQGGGTPGKMSSPGKGSAGLVGLLGRLAPLASPLLLSGDTPGGKSWRDDPRSALWFANKRIRQSRAGRAERERDDSLDNFMPVVEPGVRRPGGIHDVLNPDAFDAATRDAQRAGQEMQSALSVTASPIVDLSSINAALSAARELVRLLQQAGSAAAAARANAEAQMRRNFSDHGIVP